jgi:hypothetical protein
MVMSILLDASRTSRSRAREEELVAMATPVVIDNPELFMQARRPQPPAEAPSTQAPSNPNAMEMMRMMLEHMNKQASEHSSQIASLAALVKQNASTQQAPVQTMNRSAIGSDVQSIMNLTDAIKGQDNPTWRLAPGLILQRFITNRFKIFSIPHLLFKEEGSKWTSDIDVRIASHQVQAHLPELGCDCNCEALIERADDRRDEQRRCCRSLRSSRSC